MQAQQALELAREALFQSQKMDALGQLTGGVAHDFNNLLTAILGSLELALKRLPEDPKLRTLIDNAIQGAQRGASLTQRMLAFARRQELKTEAVDAPALVRGMTELLQRSLGPSTRIETHFPLTMARVEADANQLEMALMNLVVNARDAMPGGGAIILAAREETVSPGQVHPLPPGAYVCLSVTDEGEGMDETILSRAMEPFFTTKGTGKGTGLGLSMVHGMAEQSGGRFILKSRKGEGTTAELWLPAAAAAEAALPPRLAEITTDFAVRPLMVLAVDDDSLVLLNTAAMLEDLGHTALEASSGQAALDLLRQQGAVDLVIADYAMPHMTGTQLAQAIRAEWPQTPILLATGYAELPPGTVSDLPRLPKPFRQEDLARAIARTVPQTD
jgi:nitrogen-specific signal transduction histidine kinase